jgi:putative flippase GtrA
MVGPRGGNWKPLNASSEVRFAVIGATAAALFFVVSWSAQARGVPAFWAGLIAYGAAFTFGYLGHHSITFGSEHLHRRTMPRYAALQCICALLAAATSGLLARPHLFSAPEISAATTLVTGAFAYFGSRYWVFK